MATAAKTPPPEAPSAPGVHPKPFWSFKPRSDREAGDAIVANFALHWFPAKVFKPSLDWNYSFWLGTISAALLLLLVVSGPAPKALAWYHLTVSTDDGQLVADLANEVGRDFRLTVA